MFYAPVLFSTLGFKNDASLYSAVITRAVNVLSTIVGIYSVDKLGRRFLLLQAGVQMIFAQLVIVVLLGFKVTDNLENLNSGFSMLVVIMICTFVSAFEWSWGPLGWLIPSETFPLETRSAGQSITVCINLVFTFIIAQQPLMKPLVTRGFTTVGIEELPANDGTSCNPDTDETSCCKWVHTLVGVEELPPLLKFTIANMAGEGLAVIGREGGWGWRVYLGLAGIPALLLTVGALLVVDTPNSLIERGKLEEGKVVLIKIHRIENIKPEYLELVAASRIAKEVKHPFRNLLQRKNRP
nr:sugar transport protein 13 [Tanacetum cinerariifolium]